MKQYLRCETDDRTMLREFDVPDGVATVQIGAFCPCHGDMNNSDRRIIAIDMEAYRFYCEDDKHLLPKKWLESTRDGLIEIHDVNGFVTLKEYNLVHYNKRAKS